MSKDKNPKPKLKQRLMQRDHSLCGIHVGGCYEVIDPEDYSMDHMIPHNFIKTRPNYALLNGAHLKQPMHKSCNNDEKKGQFNFPNFVCDCHMIYFCSETKNLYVDNLNNNVWHRALLFEDVISDDWMFSLIIGRRGGAVGFNANDMGQLIGRFPSNEVDRLKVYNVRSFLLSRRFADAAIEAASINNYENLISPIIKEIGTPLISLGRLSDILVKLLEGVFRDKSEILHAHIDQIARARVAQNDPLGLSLYEASLSFGIVSSKIFNNFGWTLLERGDYARAVKLIDRATQLEPESELNWNNFCLSCESAAKAEFEKRNITACIEYCKKILNVPEPFCGDHKANARLNLARLV